MTVPWPPGASRPTVRPHPWAAHRLRDPAPIRPVAGTRAHDRLVALLKREHGIGVYADHRAPRDGHIVGSRHAHHARSQRFSPTLGRADDAPAQVGVPVDSDHGDDQRVAE